MYMGERIYDVIVIGSGPAGMSASLYASRANLDTLLVEKGAPGGQLLNTDIIENYVGGVDVNASELANGMYKDALKFGAEFVLGEVESIVKNDEGSIEIKTSKDVYKTKTSIIATGTDYRKLGVQGEDKYNGRGVSYCATCDGAFFNNKGIVVVGGGDSALEAALYLSQYGGVRLVHRRDEYRAEPYLQTLVKNNEKIEEVLSHELKEIKGEMVVNGATLVCSKTGKESDKSVQGVFINVGQLPNTSFVPEDVLSGEGWVKVDDKYSTELEGLYAIGDVIDKPVRQVANAVGEGSEVIHHILPYIQSI